jgi:hypothetical protein
MFGTYVDEVNALLGGEWLWVKKLVSSLQKNGIKF